MRADEIIEVCDQMIEIDESICPEWLKEVLQSPIFHDSLDSKGSKKDE